MQGKQSLIMMHAKNAVLKYQGKSKDVYSLPNGNVLIVFGDDDVTKEGIGHKDFETSMFLFDEISRELEIPTYRVAYDLEEGFLEAKDVKTIGKGIGFTVGGKRYTAAGFKFVARLKAWGSFLERNLKTGVKQGDLMRDVLNNPKAKVEVYAKSDDGGNLFFMEEVLDTGALSCEEYNKVKGYTEEIINFLARLFAEADMELIDMEVEFGKDRCGYGNLLLSDEISAGSVCALINGKEASKDEIHQKLMTYKKIKQQTGELSQRLNGITTAIRKNDKKINSDEQSSERMDTNIKLVEFLARNRERVKNRFLKLDRSRFASELLRNEHYERKAESFLQGEQDGLDIINKSLALKTCGTYKTVALVEFKTGKELGQYTYNVDRPEDLTRIIERALQENTIE